MKLKIITSISALFICAAAVSCGDATEKESISVKETTTAIETQTETTSAAALTTSAAETTASAVITTTAAENTSADKDEDIMTIVKEVCMRYYDAPEYSEKDAEKEAELLIDRAKEFTEQDPVEVNSEDVAMSRAKTIFIESIGQEFIDELESDYYEKNGQMLKLERNDPPYKCVYYDEYDVWAVTAVLRSGKLEDGTGLEHTGASLYVLIRGKDGALLAAHC
ncbi:hypothetical protein [Ruminococcus flavefaciens]|uniref:hypothetical protein n=1 Tax=Ruminococcus flavefaciens TaxID=1265 RepID=UPI000314DDDC|nr:hypothetical protein [Ruminococcus flavefaciens]